MDYVFYLFCFLLSWTSIRYILALFSSSWRNLPPGPIPLPIVGNLLSLGDKPHRSLAHLAQTHGPVMCLQLGSLTSIVISSPSSAKEAFRKNDIPFSHRTVPDVARSHRHLEFSIAWLPPHDQWRNIRKVANSLVFSSSRLDACSHLRMGTVRELITQVDACRRAGVAVDIGQAAFNTTLNLLSNTFFSVDLADQQLGSASSRSEFKEIVWQLLSDAGKPNLSDYFPLLKQLDLQGRKASSDIHLGKVLDIIDGMIDKRLEAAEGRTTDDSGDGDALDGLLKIIRESSGDGFNRENLRHMLADLFVAGTDTTSNTLEWTMTELMRNPVKMKKAQEELQNVIRKDVPVDERDISKLPYLQAVIKEIYRLHPAAPLLVPRRASTDAKLCGFTVPKGSQVMVNAWAIGRDPKVWKDADLFQPERFLESNIDFRGQDFELIPFGSGRRICPGIPLVSRMLPLMLASLIHSFDWRLEDGITPKNMDMEEKFGLVVQKARPLMAIPMNKI